jgi:hypothetical protein
MGSWWENRRLLRAKATTEALLGENPATRGSSDDLAAQQFKVGMFVRACFDGGFDRISLIQNLLVGACFIADNFGVSRQQLSEVILAIELKKDRQMIYKPGD